MLRGSVIKLATSLPPEVSNTSPPAQTADLVTEVQKNHQQHPFPVCILRSVTLTVGESKVKFVPCREPSGLLPRVSDITTTLAQSTYHELIQALVFDGIFGMMTSVMVIIVFLMCQDILLPCEET